MSIPECPHCHLRVIPSHTGECPACGKNTHEEPTSGKDLRLLVIRGGEAFPAICFNCAAPAKRFVKIQIANENKEKAAERQMLSLFVPFGKLFALFDSLKDDVCLRLKLPICDACRKRRIEPEIQSFDFQEREMRVIVHERFRDLVIRT